MTMIIYGPPASGKTRNKDALARYFRYETVVDEWEPGQPITPNALHLAIELPYHLPPRIRVVEIEKALKILNSV